MTVDLKEIKKFEDIANEWWDYNGKFKSLHIINPLRLRYIREKISASTNYHSTSFKDLRILDVGCGGGLVSIPLANLGALVDGVDAGEENIKAASMFAKAMNVDASFFHSSVEALEPKAKYDIILALEILEHVTDIDSFIQNLSIRLKPGGLLIASTINRSSKAFLLAIFMAENILRWVPKGTHEYSKFIKPSELESIMSKYQLSVSEIKGLSFSVLNYGWNLSDDISVNYFVSAEKKI